MVEQDIKMDAVEYEQERKMNWTPQKHKNLFIHLLL